MKSIAFIWIPRTAGTSIWGAFERSSLKTFRYHSEKRPTVPKTFDVVTFPHCNPSQVPCSYNSSFCVVRNPWDRLVSVYLHLTSFNAIPASFDKFIGGLGSVPLPSNNSGRGLWYASSQLVWARYAYVVLRFENLVRDWSEFVKINQLPLPKRLGCSNASIRAKGYRDFYSDRLRDKVASLYCEEIALYDYTF